MSKQVAGFRSVGWVSRLSRPWCLLGLFVMTFGCSWVAMRWIWAEEERLVASRVRYLEEHLDYSSYEEKLAAAISSDQVGDRESAAPVVAAEVSVAGDRQIPQDWLSFPRRGPILEEVLRDLALPSPEQWYRCKDLNPRDAYLDESRRAAIKEVLLRHSRRLLRLKDVTSTVASAEFEGLAAAGLAREVDLSEYQKGLSQEERSRGESLVKAAQEHRRKVMEELGMPKERIDALLADVSSMPVAIHPSKLGGDLFSLKVQDGKILGATLAEMPKTTESLNLRRHVLLEAVSEVLPFFVAADALSGAVSDSMLSDFAVSLRL